MEKQIWDVINEVYDIRSEKPQSDKQEELVKKLAEMVKEVKDAE